MTKKNPTDADIKRAIEINHRLNEKVSITMERKDWIVLQLCVAMAKRDGTRFIEDGYKGNLIPMDDEELPVEKSMEILERLGTTMSYFEEKLEDMELTQEEILDANNMSADFGFCFCGDCTVERNTDGTIEFIKKGVPLRVLKFLERISSEAIPHVENPGAETPEAS